MGPFRVFNGEVSNKATKVFGGESSGIRDWDDVKYPHMLEINEKLFEEYWSKNEIRLGDDLVQYKELTDAQRFAYNVITGYLTALDSFATDFNFALGFICSDSSIRSNIALVNSFEILHNTSYQYLTSTMLNKEQKQEAFNAPKDIPLLVERNNLVIEKIQNMIDTIFEYRTLRKDIDDALLEAIYEGILANLILEGIYFTGAFVYFHALARDNKMIGSNNMINLIKEDETQHSVFFGDLLKIMMLENPQLNTPERHENAFKFIKKCVEKEKEWAKFLFTDIDIVSQREYSDYVEYLSNVVCRNSGIQEVYPENTQIKSKWILNYGSKKGDKGEMATRQDFFQTNVIGYQHEDGDGFDL